jgi:hypothetical protein
MKMTWVMHGGRQIGNKGMNAEVFVHSLATSTVWGMNTAVAVHQIAEAGTPKWKMNLTVERESSKVLTSAELGQKVQQHSWTTPALPSHPSRVIAYPHVRYTMPHQCAVPLPIKPAELRKGARTRRWEGLRRTRHMENEKLTRASSVTSHPNKPTVGQQSQSSACRRRPIRSPAWAGSSSSCSSSLRSSSA